MKTVFFIITICGGALGGILLIVAWVGTESAPQQAALAAIAGAFAVIPYCVARSIQLLSDDSNQILRSMAAGIQRESRENQFEPLSRTTQPSYTPSAQRETVTQPEKSTRSGRTPSSKLCPNCRRENNLDVFSCQSCGTPLDDSVLARR